MVLHAENLTAMKMDEFLGRSFSCECGKEHRVAVERVIVENKAIDKLPEVISSFGFKKVYLAADSNTYVVAGEQIETRLKQDGFSCQTHIFQRSGELVPDETAVGEFLLGMKKDTEVILAVGSGVLNDLCKYMSWRLNIPYIVFATATSMDGYASDGAALIIDNLKTTLYTTMPKAIIADVDIVKEAPMEMIVAGLGDMLGKYSAMNDWKLSHLINGEYYCNVVAAMVYNSLEKCVENARGLVNREEEAVKNLMEGLVITGIAMSYTGNSRPASGSEHHLSHFWEMMFLFDDKKAALHGTKVGIGTLAINRMREELSVRTPDFVAIEKSVSDFDTKRWLDDIQRLFRQAAPGVIELNRKEKINDAGERLLRLKKIRENWESILAVLKEVPETRVIHSLLASVGAPVNPAEVGVDQEMVRNAVVYAKEVRARYTVLQLLWDLGMLEEFAQNTGKYFFES